MNPRSKIFTVKEQSYWDSKLEHCRKKASIQSMDEISLLLMEELDKYVPEDPKIVRLVLRIYIMWKEYKSLSCPSLRQQKLLERIYPLLARKKVESELRGYFPPFKLVFNSEYEIEDMRSRFLDFQDLNLTNVQLKYGFLFGNKIPSFDIHLAGWSLLNVCSFIYTGHFWIRPAHRLQIYIQKIHRGIARELRLADGVGIHARGFKRLYVIALILKTAFLWAEGESKSLEGVQCVKSYMKVTTESYVSSAEIELLLEYISSRGVCYSGGVLPWIPQEFITVLVNKCREIFEIKNEPIYQPRTLKHLSRVALRHILVENRYDFHFPKMVDVLPLPETVKAYMLGDD